MQSKDRWLNDNIINAYLDLLTTGTNTFALNTQVVSPIITYSRIGLSTKPSEQYRRIKILDHDIVFFPALKQAHWILAVWNKQKSELRHYDAKYNPSTDTLRLVRRYLDERRIKENKPQNFFQGLTLVADGVPPVLKQLNDYDCGVYTLMFARSIIENFEFIFTPENITQLQQIISFELITSQLLPLF